MSKHLNLAVLLITLSIPLAAYSHHGANNNPEMYLAENLVRLDGEISQIFWRNPHPRLMLTVIDEQGGEQEWELEMGSNVNGYNAMGIGEDFVQIGDRVRAAGVVSRRDPASIGLQNLLLSNGQELVTRDTSPTLWSDERISSTRRGPTVQQIRAAEESADGFFRVWGRRTGPRPSQGEYLHLFTDEGKELAAQYDFAMDNPELDCRSGLASNMFDPTPMQLINNDDHIVIYTEEYDLKRRVYMTEDRPDPSYSSLGYSTGSMDGESLVVETSHIDWQYFDPYGTPQSKQMTYKETFWIAEDDSRLNYRLEATDLVYTTGTIQLERAWLWQPGTQMVPFDCAAEVDSSS
jgi:hypothetical protein